MSNSIELFNDFSSRGIRLWAESGKLKFKAEQGRLADSDRVLLSNHKSELLQLLTAKTCKRCGTPMQHIEAGYFSCPKCRYQLVESNSGFWLSETR